MSNFVICQEIRCPFNTKNGCDRYSVSGHCHLLGKLGSERREYLQDNQYWIYGDASDPRIDINQLRDENNDFIAQDESSLRRLRCKALTED